MSFGPLAFRVHHANWTTFVIRANVIATWIPWKKSTNDVGTLFAATANIAPNNMGQHQLPTNAGIAAKVVQIATQSP